MTSGPEVLVEAARLTQAGEPYALATVVDVRPPASTRRGDRALVTGDGALVGWIGGACSEPIVVREALHALVDGETRLVRICPVGEGRDAPPGVVVAHSACASEGVVDVLVEPQLPAPLLAVVGDAPAARKLRELALAVGWRVAERVGAGETAAVVATMGHGDEEALRTALAAGTGYVGLVASWRRAGAVLDTLRRSGVGEDALARVRSPAGLDLGPSTQEEIAVAILAELVAWRHTRGVPEAVLAEAVDPVCGMTVAVAPGTPSASFGDVTYYFCGEGCRARFEREPERHLEAQR